MCFRISNIMTCGEDIQIAHFAVTHEHIGLSEAVPCLLSPLYLGTLTDDIFHDFMNVFQVDPAAHLNFCDPKH